MAKIRQLSRPPIQEAVMDFVVSGDPMADGAIEDLAKTFPGKWVSKTIRSYSAQFAFGQKDEAEPVEVKQAANTFAGVRLEDADGRTIVQFKNNQVTVSHTKKYVSWDELESEAFDALKHLLEATGASSLKRIAARYINRLPLTKNHDASAIAAVLCCPPQVPLGTSGPISGAITDFLLRYIIRDLPDGFVANYAVATVNPAGIETTNSILLDIDVYKTDLLPAEIDLISSEMRKIRAIKNEIFFGSIQEKALEGL